MQDLLLATLLDLDAELDPSINYIVCGGYGLFLKQQHLQKNPDIKTLFKYESLPLARTTQDIDLVLHAAISTNPDAMALIRGALDQLNFSAIESAKYMQFVREAEGKKVKIDLLSAPLGDYSSRVPNDPRRVKTISQVKLHARKMEESLGIDTFPFKVPVSGTLSSGIPYETEILVPQAFSYILTKLFAFKDRINDSNKELGRHHALDMYRIVGMITEPEHYDIKKLAEQYRLHQTTINAREILNQYFSKETDLGLIRLREHQLTNNNMNLKEFIDELKDIFQM